MATACTVLCACGFKRTSAIVGRAKSFGRWHRNDCPLTIDLRVGLDADVLHSFMPDGLRTWRRAA